MALQPQTSIAAHGLAVHSPHSPEQFSDGRIPEATLAIFDDVELSSEVLNGVGRTVLRDLATAFRVGPI